MDHLSLEFLRAFSSIVELDGFSKAADKVGRTQSAISMQIKRLEEAIGQKLFEKKGKKHILTNHGEILLSYARKMLELNDEAFVTLKETKLKGTIRIGIHLDLAETNLPRLICQFAKAYPEVLIDLAIDSSDVLFKKMAARKLEIAIYIAKDPFPDFKSAKLKSLPLKWLYAPEFSGCPNKSLLPLVVLGPNCKMRQQASLALNEAGLPWRIAFVSSSLSVNFNAVKSGVGITVRTPIGLPPFIKPVPASAGLPELPDVNIFLTSATEKDNRLISSLKEFVLDAMKEKKPTLAALV